MELQEKINKRIEQLEEDIQRTDSRKKDTIFYNLDARMASDISIVEDKVDLIVDFIKELKQLLN